MVVGYIRCSTAEQNLDRQIELMKSKGCSKIFAEKVSGKSTENREQLQAMLEWVREGDVVWVSEYSRLARNTLDLLEIVKEIESKGASLISDKEKIDTSTASGKLFLTILGGIAEFERSMILARQAEGIALCKARGGYLGKQEKELKGIEDYYRKWKNREINITDVADHYKVSRQTVYNRFKKMGSKA